MTARVPQAGMDRRRFLAGSVAAAALAGCASRPDRPLDVLVVGAGLAGLCAAHELQRAGQSVRVVESDSVVGGRVKTLRGRFEHDAWVDVGAQGGSDQYANFVRYCRDFNLPLASNPRPESRPDTLLQLKGRTYLQSALAADPSRWPLALSDVEKPLAPNRLLFSLLRPIAQSVGATARVLDEEFAHYDQISLATLLRENGYGAGAVALVEHTLNYNSLDTVSSLSAIRDATRFLTPGKSVFVEGGNDRLPQAFANALGDRVHTDHTVTAIDVRTGYVAVRLMTPRDDHTIYARRVVLAIPFTALRRVRMTPSLPADKQQIVDELPYTQVAKTFVQTHTSFLNGTPRIGAVYSDTPYERVFNMSYGGPSDPGMLLNWVNGAGLRQFRSLQPGGHRKRVLAWMRELWPQHADQLGKSLTFDWADTPARGAYAHYAPGQLTRFANVVPRIEGRLHFAGEHTQLVEPGMEGALTSGVRVAQEITASAT